MNTNELNRLLIKLGACSDAVEWAKPYGLQEAWERCKRPELIRKQIPVPFKENTNEQS